MRINVPDSLKGFVEAQVNSGEYADPDSFVAELLKTEEAVFERVKRGESLPIDERFDRRLEALLDEAEASGAYVSASQSDFDDMERAALETLRKRTKSS
jgi:Arc/MetJ-type ribon-helix-helix transcriptional regulator